MDLLLARNDIDPDRIGITGISMGSFWLTQIVAHDHRYKAAAGFYICHEPGQATLLNVAIPVFKDRYMWMAGYHDEDAFDEFAKKLTLEGLGVDYLSCTPASPAGTTISARSSTPTSCTMKSKAPTRWSSIAASSMVSPTTWTSVPSSRIG